MSPVTMPRRFVEASRLLPEPVLTMQAFVNRVLAVAVVLLAIAILAVVGWRAVLDRYAGAWTHAPEDAPWVLSDAAQALIDSAFADADGRAILDGHIDALAKGQQWAPTVGDRPQLQSATDKRASPLAWLSEQVRDHAAGIRDSQRAEAEYLSRLMRQIQAMPNGYRGRIVARDAVYDTHGVRDDTATVDYVDNAYVVWLADQASERLAPAVSIHPYRSDALAELARWAEAGAVGVSWRPVAQRIDLADPRVAAFYAQMKAHGLTLYLPLGHWRAENGGQGWIGADALTAALSAGLDVEARIGDPVGPEGQRLMPDLFALLRNDALASHLTLDLSGVLAPARLKTVLEPLLQHPQFFAHLRYASGYPEPAIASAIRLDALADGGFIGADQITSLRAIYDVNPLLFAFVTMRQIRLPATDLRLPASVFFAEKSS